MPNELQHGDGPGSSRRRAVPDDDFTLLEIERLRQLVREGIERSWEEVGVEFGSFKGRQEHAQLLQWIRDRREKREAGASKVVTATIGAAVSALFAAAVTYLSGKHP